MKYDYHVSYIDLTHGKATENRVSWSALSRDIAWRSSIGYFEGDEDRETFLEVLGRVVKDYHRLCHSYRLMSNHYHVIIEALKRNLSKGMRQLNGVYTQSSNRRHRRSGHVFQSRYKSLMVDKEAYLLDLSRYFVLNPVRVKGMARHAGEWTWSSYREMVGEVKAPDWLMTDWILVLQSHTLRTKRLRAQTDNSRG